jgi:hypothetical protein
MNNIKLSILSVFSLALICSACSPVSFQAVDNSLIIQGADGVSSPQISPQIKDTDIFELNAGGGVSASADLDVFVESSLGAVSMASNSTPVAVDTQLNLGFLATLFEVSF